MAYADRPRVEVNYRSRNLDRVFLFWLNANVPLIEFPFSVYANSAKPLSAIFRQTTFPNGLNNFFNEGPFAMSTPIDATGVSSAKVKDVAGFFGHPRGLSTLFFTEMWERFSFYGLRAILFLYMTESLAKGGLAFDRPYAGLIMGTYTSGVYWTPLLGGWLADKWLGARRAVLVGGIIIACGHFSMAVRTMPNFYLGLALIALGTGFLKPNVSTMVGDLYEEGDARRDAGFSIFYMGINLGALLAPLVVGYLGQRVEWHYGFGAAGVFMVIGLIQYVLGRDRLRGAGEKKVKRNLPDIAVVREAGEEAAESFDIVTAVLAMIGAVVGVWAGLRWSGAGWIGGLFPGVVGAFFGYIIGIVRQLNRAEALRVGVIFILFLFAIVFWMSFEQASTSLTLFADKLTRLNLFGFRFPSSWYQSVEPVFVVLIAPVFAAVWVKLGKRNPSSPAKFALGLVFAAIAFAIVAFASSLVRATGGAELSDAQKVGPLWLVAVYFFQALGELSLSPVGLSTVTKVSPGRMVGLMMGVWFLALSIGNFLAGIMGGAFDEKREGALLHMFGSVALITIVAALLLAVLTPLIKKMTPQSA
jgi:POT family proton-dependent oligopeptide transporter